MAVIGIDLGTTNSLAAVWRNDRYELIPNSLGEFLTPSVVSVDEYNQILTGKIAKERLISHPDMTAASFKRYMGTKKEFSLGKNTFRAEDLSSFILRQLKNDAEKYLNEPVTEAIISVPAYFYDSQRTATKLAGKLAGLKVERIINEPSAAAIAYQNSLGEDKTFLVFDLGGGTLDISVVETFENIVEIVAISGDNHLGGDDFNTYIAERFYSVNPGLKEKLSQQEKATVLRLAEQCKIALSSINITCMIFEHNGEHYEMAIDSEQMMNCCAPLFGRINKTLKHVLKDSHMRIEEIDEIILIGGSSKMPAIQKYIRHLTGKIPKTGIDPDKAVAAGAGIVAGIKCRDVAIKDLILTDICPFTLGVNVFNTQTKKPEFSPIIERNTSLPISNTKIYQTIFDNEKLIKFSIYQGESINIEDNLLLGECLIQVPPAPAGKIQFATCFTYDINGILNVDVTCLQTGTSVHKSIISNSSLSEKEIEEHLSNMQKLKANPCEQDNNRLVIARGERLFAENYGQLRDLISSKLDCFNAALKSNDILKIEKTRKAVSLFFDQIDQEDFGLNEEEI